MEPQSQEKKTARAIPWPKLVQALVYFLVLPFVPLLVAWRWTWWQAWLSAGLAILASAVSRALALRRNPDLAAERAQSTGAEGTKSWDRLIVPVIALLGPVVSYIVAGLDQRFGWSPDLPVAVNLVSAGVIVLGYALGTWAMVENRFFSSVVRIQKDRGHTVVTTGPYRFLRHPSYAGGVWAALAGPLLLGSLWALLPAGLVVVGVVMRTALEDRTLQEELPGYAEYARQTRYRLLPGVW
jgi:protein-S-isoprenylcysteine O-methyltransferase Ste14